MANSLTSITNPSIFENAPVLPSGYFYELRQIGYYVYGQDNDVYQIGIVRTSDGATIWGNPFFPNDQYPDAPSMVTTESTNTYDQWNQYYLNDEITSAALTLIGF
jgi:hypothetical protein